MPVPLLHKSTLLLRIGQIYRYEISYLPCTSTEDYAQNPPKGLWLRVRNLEPLPLRAAYLAGPFSLYVDCRPLDYNMHTKTFITAEQPLFEPQLHPGQTFWVELPCHVFKSEYRWSVDVVSQAIFNSTQQVCFDVSIASARDMGETVESSPDLSVSVHDTLDLWNLPLPNPKKPLHLVILTHGLHSNVSADMLFLKEAIDTAGENVVVKGFFGNVCKTERGIKYLGSRVAEYVVGILENEACASASKISFVGHSLGGPVQTFAIAYLEVNYPWVFKKVQPTNFITLASPMLGICHDNPTYVKMALLAGIAGRTGHDLGLQFTEKGNKPLLLLLPSGPTHRILKRFVRRTVYANAFNDGIVPLRTSALLYLDYKGLSVLLGPEKAQKAGNHSNIDVNISAKIPHELPDLQDSQSLVLLAVMSYFMPQKHSHGETEEKLKNEDQAALVEERFLKLPKPLMLESAASLLLPPLPSKKFLTDPDSREDIIIHDKVYDESDLPKVEKSISEVEEEAVALSKTQNGIKRRSSLQTILDGESNGVIKMITTKGEELRLVLLGNMTEQLEEAIAREYHKLMLWRKVLVKLHPDAHNNIVVRRRFPNAYGWPIVDHLVKNHFNVETPEDCQLTKEDTLDSGVDGVELSRMLSVDIIRRENEELDKESVIDAEHTWTQFNDEADSFDGPAGIFCDISERVLKIKNDWSTVGMKAFSPQAREAKTQEVLDAEERPNGLMGDFI